ncbi:MAG: SDR family oxidoreductase [bacterium]
MSEPKRKTALITGASSDIGWELAQIFAAEGYQLALTARRSERLRELADQIAKQGGSVTTIAKDLTQPNAAQELYAELAQARINVDVLVNNAGFGQYGRFHEADLTVQLEMIQVNVTALTHLTRLFLPDMIQRGGGGILNVASVAGFLPGPMNSVYYATKAYVISLSEALAAELEGTGVAVSVLCPGLTKTEFHQRAGMSNTSVPDGLVMDARTVAQIGYQGLRKKRWVVVSGWKNKLMAFPFRLAPRKLAARVFKKLQERRETKEVT